MHLYALILLVFAVITAKSCDTDTEYTSGQECCKLCGPGTSMRISDCKKPICDACEDGEYQEQYNKELNCKRQPICDPNLNLEKQVQSKEKYTPCKCFDDHHCADVTCVSCVKNKVCKAGEKITRNGTQMTDRECEACPLGTFSDQESALTCQPWKVCSLAFTEVSPGSSTSDRICEANKKLFIILPVVLTMLVVVVAVMLLLYFIHKKGKTGSISFIEKAYSLCCTQHTHTHIAVEEIVHTEKEEEQQEPRNQPQEDTEDLLKVETSLVPGISENGMPVIQDHSKSFLLSETETEPENISVRL